ncbi:hypothetical protein FJTKL_09319 [Diaporthe vaccinii]|uniref:Uncharacterized protein n=1 Tax=Diaporthe vaccinii TaxID=105482 RepID=A0ABR4FCC3_9PEZI
MSSQTQLNTQPKDAPNASARPRKLCRAALSLLPVAWCPRIWRGLESRGVGAVHQRWVMSWWTWTWMSTRTCRSNVVNIAGEERQGDGFSFLPTQSHPANLFTLRAIARRV